MIERKYCLSLEQWKYAQACLKLAKKFGMIEDDSEKALDERCKEKNSALTTMEQDGSVVYGTRWFSNPAYLQYELTRFKLDFVEPSEKIREIGVCPNFTETQLQAYYNANRDLFTRYLGDSFSYDEVRLIIEKRMREEVYDKLVQDILCESADR